MITINQPEILNINGRSRLNVVLDIDGKKQELWFEVDKAYEKYLCYERSDAFLIGILPWAMRKKHDITCIAPVTQELLYNLNQHLLPTLYKHSKNLHPTKVITQTVAEPIENDGGVGTGMSCGVDSFHAVLNHYKTGDERPEITHLCINNTGSFNKFSNYARYGADKAKREVYERARNVASLLNLPLIETDSNILGVVGMFVEVHTYTSTFATLCLQKLWKTYFFASTLDYSYFSLEGHEYKDPCLYDLLLFSSISTRGLRIYSEGSAIDRLQKTAFIVDYPVVQKYLHACHREGGNCGICVKCRRTMMTLDILGKLDLFKDSFPVDYYKNNIDEYLTWFAKVWIEEQLEGKNTKSNALGGNYYERFPQNQPLYPHILAGPYGTRYSAILASLKNALPSTYPQETIIRVLGKGDIPAPPSIRAKCAIIMDAKTGKLLYEKNADVTALAPCAAKTLTCIMAINKGQLDRKVPMIGTDNPDEKMTILDLLYGMMLSGYNNCSDAVAVAISGSVSEFVAEMNVFAKKLGMQDAKFSSASGAGGDKASPRDIAVLMRHALQNPLFRKIIATTIHDCTSSHQAYNFESTNALIHQKEGYNNRKYELCIGGKTGRIGQEGSFISVSQKRQKLYILVQLAITDSINPSNVGVYGFVDSAKIHEWAFDAT